MEGHAKYQQLTIQYWWSIVSIFT